MSRRHITEQDRIEVSAQFQPLYLGIGDAGDPRKTPLQLRVQPKMKRGAR
jgi:hypothetical protein